MKIALDFDGVLSHTMKRWVAVYNTKPNKHAEISTRDIDKWAFFENWGMNLEEAFGIFDECWRDWEKLEPLEPDQWQKTKMLCNLGEMDIVTAVTEKYLPNIETWARCKGLHYNKLIHSNSKQDLDYDIYIDDSPKNILEIFDAGKVALMYNQPWNRHVEELQNHKGGIIRIYNLYHAIDVIREYVRQNGKN